MLQHKVPSRAIANPLQHKLFIAIFTQLPVDLLFQDGCGVVRGHNFSLWHRGIWEGGHRSCYWNCVGWAGCTALANPGQGADRGRRSTLGGSSGTHVTPHAHHSARWGSFTPLRVGHSDTQQPKENLPTACQEASQTSPGVLLQNKLKEFQALVVGT